MLEDDLKVRSFCVIMWNTSIVAKNHGRELKVVEENKSLSSSYSSTKHHGGM